MKAPEIKLKKKLCFSRKAGKEGKEIEIPDSEKDNFTILKIYVVS